MFKIYTYNKSSTYVHKFNLSVKSLGTQLKQSAI